MPSAAPAALPAPALRPTSAEHATSDGIDWPRLALVLGLRLLAADKAAVTDTVAARPPAQAQNKVLGASCWDDVTLVLATPGHCALRKEPALGQRGETRTLAR